MGFFQRESNTSYGALRSPDLAYYRDPKREVEQWMDCGIVKVHIPEVEQACGE